MSRKQFAAHRQNARKSTGPRTDEGNVASRVNALKHGLLAKDVVLPNEDPARFDELYEGLAAEFQPQTAGDVVSASRFF